MIFDKIIKFNDKLGYRLRETLIAMIFSLLGILWILNSLFHFSRIGYFAMFCILIASILSYTEKIQRSSIHKCLIIMLELLALSYIIAAFRFNDANRISMAFSFGVLLPALSLLLANKKNRKIIITGFARGNVLTFVFIIIVSIIFAPLLDEQYSSIVFNPNELSTLLLPITSSLIYLIEVNRLKQNKINMCVLVVLFGFDFSYMLFSRSRTGMLAFLMAVVIWIIYLLFNTEIKKTTIFINIVAIVLISVILVPINVNLLTVVNNKIMIKEASTFGKYYIFSLNRYGIGRYNGSQYEGQRINSKQAVDGMIERSEQGSSYGEDISSGRFSIWNSTINDLNCFGHDSHDTFYVPHRKAYTNDTHNMYLSIGYFNGVPAILFSMVLMIEYFIILISRFFNLLKRRSLNTEFMYTLLITSSFVLVSMLSTTYTILGSMLGMAFWTMMSANSGENDYE